MLSKGEANFVTKWIFFFFKQQQDSFQDRSANNDYCNTCFICHILIW